MSKNGGVFAVARDIFEHDFFAQEAFTEREAWIWMIREAAWKPRKIRVGRKRCSIGRGQFATSLRFMAAKWQWPEARVRRFLKRLKIDAMIDAVSDALATQITICNYDDYQIVGLPSDAPSDAANDALATQTRKREYSLAKAKAHSAPPDFKQELFAEGLASICRQTSKTEGQARRLIGKWLKEADNDSRKVLTKIRQAEADQVIDTAAWVTKALASDSEYDFLWARG
ncbi:MAG: hypothetical protein KF810_17435 [Rhizobiaceae bacterium]|nr:hypothetical protein [Rhizobiaceae bacterium]